MAEPWTYAGPVAQLDASHGVVTLVDESTFAISGGAGDIIAGRRPGPLRPGHPDPLPLRAAGQRGPHRAAVGGDRRPLLGHLRLALPAPARAGRLHPDGLPVALRRPGDARGPHHPQLRRRAALCSIELFVGADFADLFAVKEGRAGTGPGDG